MVLAGSGATETESVFSFRHRKEDTDQLTEALDTILTQAEQKSSLRMKNSDFRKLIRFLIVIIII